MDKKYFKYSTIASCTIVTLPILQCYNFNGIAVNKFLMLILVLLFFAHNKSIRCVSNKLKTFLFYALIFPPIVALLYDYGSQFIGSFIQLGLFFVLYLLFQPYVNIDLIKKYYTVLSRAAIFVFILQEVVGMLTGSRFGVLIPFLDLYNDMPVSSYMAHYKSFERSCSFFVEPSHFVQYIAPYLAVLLNDISKKGKFCGIEPILISFIFLLSKSGTGYFLCATIWLVHFLTCQIKLRKKIMVIFPISFILIIYGFTYLSNTQIGTEVLERAETIDANYTGDAMSATIRIYRGFWVQLTMPIIAKVFGVGLGGADAVIDKSPFNYMFNNEHYLNNASGFLIAFGFIGTILLLMYVLSLCRRFETGSIMVVAAFICLCFLESFMMDSRMLLYLIIPYAYTVKKNVTINGDQI